MISLSRDGQENKLKLKPVVLLSPLAILLLSGTARAALEPFTLGASENVEHQSNIDHTDEASAKAAWISTTEFQAALDEAIGRNRLTAAANLNYATYSNDQKRNSLGYHAAAALDWNTVGDLSGSLGADSTRRQYIYGGVGGGDTASTGRNLETTNHAFAQIELGGLARWNLFAGASAMNRNYSNTDFDTNDQRQVSTNVGTRYSTSPDLSFGITGAFVRGEYPHYLDAQLHEVNQSFSSRSVSATTRWNASGNSALDANVGYTTENSDLQPSQHFVSGGLNWSWTPPSHFKVRVGLSRSMSGGVASGTLNDLNDRSLNNVATASVDYALTAKVSLATDVSYIQRKYSNVQIPFIQEDGTLAVETVNGSSHSTRVGLSVHYKPTRIADLSCGGWREVRSSGTAVRIVAPGYTDNVVQCKASVSFD
jgi:hypothetical protein